MLPASRVSCAASSRWRPHSPRGSRSRGAAARRAPSAAGSAALAVSGGRAAPSAHHGVHGRAAHDQAGRIDHAEMGGRESANDNDRADRRARRTRGEMRVTPAATTTYTLTVTGVNGTLTRTVTVTVAGTTPVAASAESVPLDGQTGARERPMANRISPASTDTAQGRGAARRHRPQAPGELPRTPTLKPGAEKYRVERGPDDTGLYSSCAPPGVPQTFFVPYYVQFVQSPKYLVILHEYLHLYRVIPLDGSPHPPDPDPFWMGHSTGKVGR